MSEQIDQNQDQGIEDEKSREGRNLGVVFLGFVLLGLALGVLFFGADLLDSFVDEDGDSVSEDGESILDRAGALPAVEPGEARIKSGSNQGGYLVVGDKAHDFELFDFDGNKVSLSEFQGQPVIVNFWATWCAPCRVEMPELQKAFDNYQDEGLIILALDQDETVDRAREFFYDEMELSFIPLLDDNSAVSTAYSSLSVLPTTYFLDPDGIVSAIHHGPLTLGQIEGYLDKMDLG
jgi:peroxiredoxin